MIVTQDTEDTRTLLYYEDCSTGVSALQGLLLFTILLFGFSDTIHYKVSDDDKK